MFRIQIQCPTVNTKTRRPVRTPQNCAGAWPRQSDLEPRAIFIGNDAAIQKLRHHQPQAPVHQHLCANHQRKGGQEPDMDVGIKQERNGTPLVRRPVNPASSSRGNQQKSDTIDHSPEDSSRVGRASLVRR